MKRTFLTCPLRTCAFAVGIVLAAPLMATHPGASEFARDVAAETGLDEAWILEVLAGAEYKQTIIDAITRPAESKPWHEYRRIFLDQARIESGVEFWRANRGLIEQVSEHYGVAAPFVLAITGVETRYGMVTGGYRVLDALVTLGFYYPRRAEFFAGELAEFFRLAREEELPLDQVKGSYAGAMGLGQFIPSSYRAYAVDFDESGSRDLWRSLPDALGSVANYLNVHGWISGQPTVLPVTDMANAPDRDFALKPTHTLAELEAMGIGFDRGALAPDTPATLIELEGENGPEYWVGLNNFYVITRYNRSPLYAMAVTQLAKEIANRAPAVLADAQ